MVAVAVPVVGVAQWPVGNPLDTTPTIAQTTMAKQDRDQQRENGRNAHASSHFGGDQRSQAADHHDLAVRELMSCRMP